MDRLLTQQIHLVGSSELLHHLNHLEDYLEELKHQLLAVFLAEEHLLIQLEAYLEEVLLILEDYLEVKLGRHSLKVIQADYSDNNNSNHLDSSLNQADYLEASQLLSHLADCLALLKQQTRKTVVYLDRQLRLDQRVFIRMLISRTKTLQEAVLVFQNQIRHTLFTMFHSATKTKSTLKIYLTSLLKILTLQELTAQPNPHQKKRITELSC